jgi:general secretion pathway protein G
MQPRRRGAAVGRTFFKRPQFRSRPNGMKIRLKSAATAGFSLLELLAVVVIIGLLAAILTPRASAARSQAVEKACAHNRMLINSAIERFAVTTGANPTSLNDLNVPDYFPEGIPVCPVSGAAYTLNPATQRVDGHSSGSH